MQIYGLVSKSWNVWFEDLADLNEFRAQHLTASTDPGVTVLDVLPRGPLTQRAADASPVAGEAQQGNQGLRR